MKFLFTEKADRLNQRHPSFPGFPYHHYISIKGNKSLLRKLEILLSFNHLISPIRMNNLLLAPGKGNGS